MRDYSFGNFISALRERRGLSQYQLGVLVGVSDKAVSKWENGASKPRIDTIRKLSEVLDVSVDELLTCEYAAFNKERKDLFAMKNEMMRLAGKKLSSLYGEHPPILIANRFKTEKLLLHEQDILLWMGFLGKLQEKFTQQNAYFDIRGAQIGASFVAWLLGGSNVNPLPAHYYCPVCKSVEFVSTEKCGIDLLDKKCTCGMDYQKDGFSIDAVHMYPLTKWLEIYVSSNATDIVKKCLEEYFKGAGEIRELRIMEDETIKVPPTRQMKVTKYAVFSKELTKKYSEDVITLPQKEYFGFMDELPVLNVVENPEETLCSQDLMNMSFTPEQIKAYFLHAAESGEFNGYTGDMNLEKVISQLKNPKFSDLLILQGFLHGTGVWKENAEVLYDKGIPLHELISCREDVYDYLYRKLNGKCCDNPVGQVFEIKESVRKGKYSRNRMPAEIETLLLECDVEQWYVDSMKKILYLFPKTHLIPLLKRQIAKYVVANHL